MVLGSIDRDDAEKEENKVCREISLDKRLQKEALRKQRSEEVVVLENSTSPSSSAGSDHDDIVVLKGKDDVAESSGLKRKRSIKKIITPEFVASLDRGKVSNRVAMRTIAATMQSLGAPIEEFSISATTFHRARTDYRETHYNETKENFEPDVPLVVHWDGKMMADIAGSGNVERLSVLVTGRGVEKLLGVPKLPDSKGEAIATAVVASLHEWDASNLINNLCGMSFDTAASNTGSEKGACNLLEEKLGKELLNLACRHHITEVVAGSVFKIYFPTTSGPDVAIFKRFKQAWKNIKKDDFSPTVQDEEAERYLSNVSIEKKLSIINFLKKCLQDSQPRDDYKELLELCLIYLGEQTPSGIRFKAPGAFHHARWMAKLIYSIKIWLIRDQFKMVQPFSN